MKCKVSLLLTLCLILALAMPALASADALYGQIKTSKADGSVNIRSAAGVSKPVIGWAQNGDEVEILYRGNNWHKVEVTSTGETGWVYAKYVKIGSSSQSSSGSSSAVSGTVAVVTTKYASSTVNVRTGAGTGYASVASVGRGTQLSVLGSSNGWTQVYVPSKGVTGYIANSYVDLGLTAKATGDVNLRSGAGTGYDRILVIPKGSALTVLSVGDSWSQVTYKGSTGYISNKYWSCQ